jgi:hypothetical protein
VACGAFGRRESGVRDAAGTIGGYFSTGYWAGIGAWGENQEIPERGQLMKQSREFRPNQFGHPTWRVELSRRAVNMLVRHGSWDSDFNPPLLEAIARLECEPKQFAKMDGEMGGIRAVPLRYRCKPWRMPFVLDEQKRTVTIIAVEHGDALEARHRDAIRLRRRARRAREKQAVLGRL